MYTCQYCNKQYDKNTEHVFPMGLGGENVIISCVCITCNNKFSDFERELYQKSPVALIRSVEGLYGYNNKGKRSAFKAPFLLSRDKNNNIVYEVGQTEKMGIYIRPQIIEIEKEIYFECESQNFADMFFKKFGAWKKNNPTLILEFPNLKGDPVRFVEFQKSENGYISKIITDQLKVKNEITLALISPKNHLYKLFYPRIYMDDDDRIKIRAKSEAEAIHFATKVLDFSDKIEPITSYSPEKHLPEVSVEFDFNSRKCEQALVKVGLNIIFHYFEETRNKKEFSPYIHFVNTGEKKFDAQSGKKDMIRDSIENTHNIFIAQCESFVDIRISLFNGQFVYSFIIPGLRIAPFRKYFRIVIDYKKSKNTFQNQGAFLQSFYKL